MLALPLAAATLDEARAALRLHDYASAAQIYTTLAAQGDGEARYQLAMLYRTGTGVAPDPTRAAQLMGEAAQAGDARAQYLFAQMLEQGTGLDRDARAAHEWYGKAAAAGHAQAQQRLAAPSAPTAADGDGARLRRAAQRGDLAQLRELLAGSIAVDAADAHGVTALGEAVDAGHTDAVEVLLAAGADATHADGAGSNALHRAAQRGDAASIQSCCCARVRRSTRPTPAAPRLCSLPHSPGIRQRSARCSTVARTSTHVMPAAGPR